MSATEPKAQEKSKGQQRYEEMMAQIAEITKKMEAFKPPTENIASSKTKEEDPYEHVHACPTCKAKLEKEKEDYAFEKLQKTLKERAAYPLKCRKCGLGVKIEEESCIACGNKSADIR